MSNNTEILKRIEQDISKIVNNLRPVEKCGRLRQCCRPGECEKRATVPYIVTPDRQRFLQLCGAVEPCPDAEIKPFAIFARG